MKTNKKLTDMIKSASITTALGLSLLGIGASQLNADEIMLKYNPEKKIIQAYENESYIGDINTDVDFDKFSINYNEDGIKRISVYLPGKETEVRSYICNIEPIINRDSSSQHKDYAIATKNMCQYANLMLNNVNNLKFDNYQKSILPVLNSSNNYSNSFNERKKIDDEILSYGSNTSDLNLSEKKTDISNLGKGY